MRRIAGILNFEKAQPGHDEIDRMIRKMKLQEQEQPQCLLLGEVGFASLSIGSEKNSGGDGSPCLHPNGKWMIVFDGHIHNRQELKSALGSELFTCSDHPSDEEIILAAYGKWRLEFLTRLVGDFAFVIWDSVDQLLLCVRDHFGVKPLYYSFQNNGLFFASTPVAILASGKVSPRVNDGRIADHLVPPLERVDKSSTVYRDIFRLPSAHVLIVHSNKMTIRRYWDLSGKDQEDLKSENDYIESFSALFEESIRCRLEDSLNSAAMLSGGMDSSSIVSVGHRLLAQAGNNQLPVFAAISTSPDTNRETKYINSVLGQSMFNVSLISELELLHHMDELVEVLADEAEPFDCFMNLNRLIYLYARQRNISAVLDGVDGDLLLSGSGHLVQLWHQRQYNTILYETLKADGLTVEYKTGWNDLINGIFSFITSMVPYRMRQIRRHMLYRSMIHSSVASTIISREFAVRVELGQRFAKLASHNSEPSDYKQMEYHRITLNNTFLTAGLERYERVASAFGIEARHPFTDIRLVEFCLGLPWQLKTQHGWTKYILRRAMEPYLPADVVWRRDKDSLMWEYNRIILKSRAEYFHQATLDEKENLKPYVDTQKLEKIWHEYLTEGDEKHAVLIWSGIALAFWLRRHRNMVKDLKL